MENFQRVRLHFYWSPRVRKGKELIQKTKIAMKLNSYNWQYKNINIESINLLTQKNYGCILSQIILRSCQPNLEIIVFAMQKHIGQNASQVFYPKKVEILCLKLLVRLNHISIDVQLNAVIVLQMGRGGKSGGGHSKSSFGRSHGHSSHSRGHSILGHGHSHHHHSSNRRSNTISNEGKIFQVQIDAIASVTTAPTLINGGLNILGSQITVINHLNQRISSPQALMYQPQPQMYPPPLAMYQPPGYPQQVQMMNLVPTPPIIAPQPFVTQAQITVVGNKTAPSDDCIYTIVAILGACLIFPLLFLCCMWFKKMIYPKYDLSRDFYRSLGAFLRKEGQCKVLRLTVVDNCFNTEKSRALYECLEGTQLTTFTFVNRALECNYLGQQADDFKANVTTIKSLPFTSSFTWGEQIV